MTWSMFIFWLPVFFFAWAMANPATALRLLDELQHPEKRWFRRWLAAKEKFNDVKGALQEQAVHDGLPPDIVTAMCAHDEEAIIKLLGPQKAKPYLELLKEHTEQAPR